MTREQKISYSEGLMDIATDLYARAHLERMAQLPGVRAKLLRQSDLCRALAQLVEDAADLHEQHATTHLPGHDEAWDMLAAFRAGFTAAPPLPAGGVGTDETATA